MTEDAEARTRRYSEELNRLYGYLDQPVDFTPLGEHVLVDLIMRELRVKKEDGSSFMITVESKNIAIAGELAKVAQAAVALITERNDLVDIQQREFELQNKKSKPASQHELEALQRESEN